MIPSAPVYSRTCLASSGVVMSPLLELADRVVLGPAGEAARARATVQRQQLHAAVLGDLRDLDRVLARRVPAGAELQCDRHVHRLHHRLEDLPYQRLVPEQGRARHGVADLLRGATHVDVDDLGALPDVVARGVRHHRRLGAGDLHRDRLDLAVVVGAPARLLAAPEERIRGHHLGYGQARAELLAQLPEGAVRDTGHRRDKKIISQRARTDSH
jgi:hypothetical protein